MDDSQEVAILTQGYSSRFKVKHCHQKICTRFDATFFSAASIASVEAYQHQTMPKRGVGIKEEKYCRSAM